MFKDEFVFGLAGVLLLISICFGYQFNFDVDHSNAASAHLFACMALGFVAAMILVARMIFGPYHSSKRF